MAQKPSQLIMLNGRIYNVRLHKIEPPAVEFTLLKNKKTYKSSGEKIFSVVDSTGKTTYLYYQDSLMGREFTIEQTEKFIHGLNDGRHYRHGGDFAVGFASGVGGSFLGVLYGWSAPILATTLNTLRPVKPRQRLIYHPELQYDKYYTEGVVRKIRQRRFLSTMVGGLTGMGVGIAVFQFLLKPKNP